MKKIFFLLMILTLEVISFANDQPWVPPVGIPAPSFGINETYRMYDSEPNRNPALTYHESDSGGYYTHYIDSTDPNATNTNNPYGTEDKPRLSIPRGTGSPPAGSIVEVHNNMNDNATSWSGINIGSEGTEQYPVFIRGVDEPNIADGFNIGFYDNAQYMIIEGFKLRGIGIRGRQNNPAYRTTCIAARNCDIDKDGGTGGLMGISSYSTANGTIDNIVIYNNTIHDAGQWDPNLSTGDNDYHGITVNSYASYLWILDNEIYHCEGDGVQINGVDANAIHHVYMGGNTVYSNKQSGLWTKTASDVIFSQNTVHAMRQSTSSDGGGIGIQYDCKRVWVLFNTLYDNKHGIIMVSQNDGTREDIYMIGNLIYDSIATGDGIQLHNQLSGVDVLMNTIYNCPIGIDSGWYRFSASIYNNIIAGCPTAIDLLDGQNSASLSSMGYNLLDGTGNIIWDNTYADLAAFQAGTVHGDNCLEVDPLFVDPAKGNFNLQESSPVKDMGTSEKVQAAFNRFLQLYGIDLAADVDGIPRTGPTIVLPDPEETSGSDADVDTDTGSNDTSTEVTETPSVPAEDTGSSTTEETVVSPVISPSPTPEDTAAIETNSGSSNSENYSTISTLFSTSNGELHVDSNRNTKARTIKVRRIYDRYDDLYCPSNRNLKSSESYE